MKIGVVGLGYVGLPLVVAFCEEGHEVIGVDADTRVVEGLEARRSHIEDVPDSTLAAVSGRFHATLAAATTALSAPATKFCKNASRFVSVGHSNRASTRRQAPFVGPKR